MAAPSSKCRSLQESLYCVGYFFKSCEEITLCTSAEVSTIRQCRGTCLILVMKELFEDSTPRLAANVEEFAVILDRGELLLTFALAS